MILQFIITVISMVLVIVVPFALFKIANKMARGDDNWPYALQWALGVGVLIFLYVIGAITTVIWIHVGHILSYI